jgi:hypothetical protein
LTKTSAFRVEGERSSYPQRRDLYSEIWGSMPPLGPAAGSGGAVGWLVDERSAPLASLPSAVTSATRAAMITTVPVSTGG